MVPTRLVTVAGMSETVSHWPMALRTEAAATAQPIKMVKAIRVHQLGGPQLLGVSRRRIVPIVRIEASNAASTLTAAPPSAEPARNVAPPIRMEGLRPKAPVTGDAKIDKNKASYV
ncbi:hypothetical protein Gogos_016201, partial [Gossypium gossypioides]|nr:hypothetical protein [Gossypium gossypioides]